MVKVNVNYIAIGTDLLFKFVVGLFPCLVVFKSVPIPIPYQFLRIPIMYYMYLLPTAPVSKYALVICSI